MTALRFEVHDAEGVQPYFWHVVAGDDIVARSETMYRKASALSAAQKVKAYANMPTHIQFEVFLARNGKFDWHAKAANHEIMISSTKWYEREAGARAAADLVRINAATAVIEDMTRTATRW